MNQFNPIRRAQPFDITRATSAEVTSTGNLGFFYAVNGDPKKAIFCHFNDGGRLELIDGRLVWKYNPNIDIQRGDEVALIRISDNRKSGRAYTKAAMWVPKCDMEAFAWYENAGQVYRAIGYDFTRNGNPQHRFECQIFMGTLAQFVQKYPRTGEESDPLNSFHVGDDDGIPFSYKIRWERVCEEKGCTYPCTDPRPLLHRPTQEPEDRVILEFKMS